ncbi:hypothetical protein FVF58_04095 [Paraburkholderia panacisoli]|uniref:Transposase IS4-like domain-containing protein n=1 Tax=Paraburkholderia panacisoli TaxID=2603818 RepID=A0A5B0HJ68_9BURK|nr:transposase [Paraburkholderia panacisoli]KAA1015112.1 hypothetical protein FVF58_04095 [Paraburkholderia panacisoli]
MKNTDSVLDQVVELVAASPLTQEHWVIDYRIYDPDSDGKTKLDHVREMLTNLVHHKRVPFRRVLMDTWYAARELMLFIESLPKIYYSFCPRRANRQVHDSGATSPYQRIDSREWDVGALAHGKTIKIKVFPKHHKVKLFRVEGSTHRTDHLTQDSSLATHNACGLRWKIEQFHREAKQLTGIERSNVAKPASSAITLPAPYSCGFGLLRDCQTDLSDSHQVKHQILDDFLRQQLKNPSLRMKFA